MVKLIKSILTPLSNDVFILYIDSDRMFPALGFGGKLPDGTVSHEFFLVSKKELAKYHTVTGRVTSYSTLISCHSFSFHPIRTCTVNETC